MHTHKTTSCSRMNTKILIYLGTKEKRSLDQLSALPLLKYVVLITAQQSRQRKFDNEICKFAEIQPQHASM